MHFSLKSMILFIFCCSAIPSVAFEYAWQIDETPERRERISRVDPIIVTLLDEPQLVPPYTAAL